MATTFVQLTEEDPAYELVGLLNLINDPVKYEASKKKASKRKVSAADEEEDEEAIEAKLSSPLGKLVEAGKYSVLLDDGLFKSLPRLFETSADEIDAAFSLAFALLPRFEAKELSNLIARLSDVLSEKPQTFPLPKLRLLIALFNVVENAAQRASVFVKVLKFTVATNQSPLLVGSLARVEEYLTQWGTSLANAPERALLAEIPLYVSQIYQAAGNNLGAQEYLYKYLKGSAGTKELAVRLAVAAINLNDKSVSLAPWWDYTRIMEAEGVKALSKDSKFGPVVALLQIFAELTVVEYYQWQSKNQALISEIGVDHEAVVAKLNTLTLCTIGWGKSTLPYSEIKSKLQLKSMDDVEAAVLDAVVSGKVDARIDQAEERVIISRTTQRGFKNEDWAVINEKLSSWKYSIEELLITIKKKMDARSE